MELLDVVLRLLAPATPDNGTAVAMNFHHVLFRALAVPAKDPAEDHRDVAHQVHRIIVNDDQPREIKRLGEACLRRIEQSGLAHGRRSAPPVTS